ncbi:MAG TPA: phage holin family protein [Bacillota bacterium]|nr:phage holin family protein [Bacillota bacterium]
MRKLLLKWVLNIIAFYLATVLFPSVHAAEPGTIFVAGVVLGVINLLIRPVLLLLTIPINILTLGLFTLVINTLMVMLTDTLVDSLDIPSFGVAFLIALMVSVLNMFFAETEKNR